MDELTSASGCYPMRELFQQSSHAQAVAALPLLEPLRENRRWLTGSCRANPAWPAVEAVGDGCWAALPEALSVVGGLSDTCKAGGALPDLQAFLPGLTSRPVGRSWTPPPH